MPDKLLRLTSKKARSRCAVCVERAGAGEPTSIPFQRRSLIVAAPTAINTVPAKIKRLAAQAIETVLDAVLEGNPLARQAK